MTDITFTYRANFFLFATLDNARPIAQGRMAPTPANHPILTGTPVAGMSYLDRPSPAGYFIFPDLSVRHEGQYRLSFSLFEELKDANDEDSTEQVLDANTTPTAGAHVNSRCEVKSAPFTVYSAKKFPGLAESTALSRMVADQGCRVRIRRDVRMRRRDTKNPKEWDDYEDPATLERTTRPVTPDTLAPSSAPTPPPSQQPIVEPTERPRSVVNVSTASAPMAPRRQTSQDMTMPYQQGYLATQMAPQPPQHAYPPQQGHYEQTHYLQYAPQPFMHQQHAPQQIAQFQPPPSPYGYQPQSPAMMQMQQGYGYMPQQQSIQQPLFDQQMSQMRHDGMFIPPPPPNYQRDHMVHPQYSTQSQMPAPLGPHPESGYGRQNSTIQQMYPSQPTIPTASGPTMNGNKALPTLNTMEILQAKFEPSTPSNAACNLPTYPGYQEGIKAPPPPSRYVTQSTGIAPKRSYGSVFDTQPIDQPLRGGARPSDISPKDLSASDDNSDDDLELEQVRMQYRRADGTQISRRWPPSI